MIKYKLPFYFQNLFAVVYFQQSSYLSIPEKTMGLGTLQGLVSILSQEWTDTRNFHLNVKIFWLSSVINIEKKLSFRQILVFVNMVNGTLSFYTARFCQLNFTVFGNKHMFLYRNFYFDLSALSSICWEKASLACSFVAV